MRDYEETAADLEFALPGWLLRLLDSARTEAPERAPSAGAGEATEPPAALRARCREAAEVALAVARLRQERRRMGFVLLPLAQYLQGLARGAGQSLAAVLRGYGISDLTPGRSEAWAAAVARLCRQLELSLREALLLVRLGLAAEVGASIPVLAKRGGAVAGQDGIELCERTLGEIEAEYEAELLNRVRLLESAIRGAYAE